MSIVIETIKSRRSIRKFLSDQIKQEELDTIIEAGIYAPTGHNDQPWHFTVIQNKELIDHINNEAKKNMVKAPIEFISNMGKSDKLHIFHGAPTVIVISGKKDATTPLIDCSAAVQNILLAAESFNIGSCWIGLAKFFFQNPGNAEELDNFFQTNIDDKFVPGSVEKLSIPEGYEPYFAVTLGYKASKDIPTPKRRSDVINYIK
ncbi:MAG: nitroreductase family protein [Methanobacterium sp.]|jgi:nitroreductase